VILTEVGGTRKHRAPHSGPWANPLWIPSRRVLSVVGFDEGPRATPAIAEGRVFTIGAEGRLSCWSLADGTAVRGVDTQKEFGLSKGFFGRACSPLVEGNLVILNVGGGGGAGIVAFEARAFPALADGRLSMHGARTGCGV